MNYLKTNIIAIAPIFLFLFAFSANGQNSSDGSNKSVEFGFRLMPTYSSLSVQSSSGNTVSGEATLGFGMGAFLGFNFNQHVGVQGEVIYSSISQKSTINNAEQKINLRYVNIPLLLSLNTGKSKFINLNAVAGPQVGFKVGSSLTTSGTVDPNNPQPVLSVKKNDLGFAYGLGVDFGLNPSRSVRLSLGYRGVLGILDVSDNSKTATNNTYYILDRSHIKTNAIYAGLSILF